MKEKNRWGKNILFYPLDTIEGIEIDYEEDLRLAKFVFKGMGIKNELN
jgi:CMP-N-acetylneuraminic acid synthetase